MSDQNGWRTFCSKQNPETCANFSPIKPIAYHLFSLAEFNKDHVVNSLMWSLLNNEEFHYQNTGSIVNTNFEDGRKLRNVMFDNTHVVDWNVRLITHSLLGKGCFGKVYRVKDVVTKEKYALKVLNPPEQHNLWSLFSFISRLLVERNVMSELNKCIFFVRLLAAFQDKKTKFNFLMEFCICNLTKLYSFYPESAQYLKLIKYWDDGTLPKRVSSKLSKLFQVKFKDLIFMYFFEMLCGLHYLASRHIIHADIKPDNILISVTGHLKIADLGLSFRNQWFDRSSITTLPVNQSDLRNADRMDKEGNYMGSESYMDPEIKIYRKKRNDNKEEHLSKHYKNNVFYQNLTNLAQNFMSDLYAVGVTFFEIYFAGLDLLDVVNTNEFSTNFMDIDIIYDTEIREETLVIPILKMCKDQDCFSIMSLLLSILQPREIRAQNLLSEIEVYNQSQLKVERFIDIKKVENIVYYRSRAMTKENVVNIKLPKKFLKALTKPLKFNNPSDEEISGKNEIILVKYSAEEKAFRIHPFEYKY